MLIDQKIIKQLKSIVGDEWVQTGLSVRELHSHDESFHEPSLPDVVVFPIDTEEVRKIVMLSYENDIPITPWGAGTSLEGNPIPVFGGILIDFQRMNRILEIRPEDFQVDVQVGVIYKDLNNTLSKYGLFFAPDPGAPATIGGMIANNASGIRTVKYGSTKDSVLRVKVVLPHGNVIEAGSRTRKSSSGYNLCSLFVGSEGTLGIVTEATLRLTGIPKNYMAFRIVFGNLMDATDTVFQIMSAGLDVAALEFLDEDVMKVLNHDHSVSLHEMPTLLLEFHSYSEEGLKEQMAFVEEICKENRCFFIDKGIGVMERNRLWEMRHLTFESIKRYHPGLSPLIVDVAVPLSKYSEMVSYIKSETRDLVAYIFGHAGDGNIHVILMDDLQKKDRWRYIQLVNEKIVLKALQLQGTCTGEHGIGIGKRKFLIKEHGETVMIMKKIKELIDPKGLLNPGKLFI